MLSPPPTPPQPPGDDKPLPLKYLLIECIGSNARGVDATRLTPYICIPEMIYKVRKNNSMIKKGGLL